jgi:hypothetical protein
MAPLAFYKDAMNPPAHNIMTSPVIRPLHRRWTSCSSSVSLDTTCSKDRTILLSIISAVVVLTVLLLTTLYIRHRKWKASNQTPTSTEKAWNDVEKRNKGEKRRTKESKAKNARESWIFGTLDREGQGDPGLEVPPPAYTYR